MPSHLTMAVETEIKLAIQNPESTRELLKRTGYEQLSGREHEYNELWDAPAGDLRLRGELLRLRTVAGTSTLTYKGVSQESARYKKREEIESAVGHAGAIRSILERLGFVCTFQYEKFRTEFGRRDESGLILLDETPIGVYLELEGEQNWIDSTAEKLGFTDKHYITTSYGALYRDFCRKRGREPGNMLYAEGDEKRP